MESVFSHTESPVILVSKQNIIKRVNQGFEVMTGYREDQVVNRPLGEWLEAEGWNMLPFEGQEILRQIQRTYALRCAEGEPFTVRTEEIPIGEGDEEERLIFIFDCTEMENIFRENLHMARLASLGKLMTGIIHEISNPLSIITGCAQLLTSMNPPPEIAMDLDRIYSESRRTSDLLKTVLSFGRKQKEAKEKLSMHDVIEEVSALKRYSLKNNNVKLRCSFECSPTLHVYGYKSQLMQVFLNLINNAEQAIADTGGKGAIGIQVNHSNEKAVVTVSDSGPGIGSEDRSRVFDAFYTTKRENRGTGLGLYISRSIINKHEGDLRLVESEAGNTVFEINLPLWREGERRHPEPHSAEML